MTSIISTALSNKVVYNFTLRLRHGEADRQVDLRFFLTSSHTDYNDV